MKKSIIALTFACAGVIAYAGNDVTRDDKTQWNEGWFTGIGDNPATVEPISLGSVNAEWSGISSSNATINSNKQLVLDLDTDEMAIIDLGGTTPPVDTNTCHVIKFNAVLTPISSNDLASITESFTSDKPQTGFALVRDSEGNYSYQVFNGDDEWKVADPGSEAIDPTVAKSVEIKVDYMDRSIDDNPQASITVNNVPLTFDDNTTSSVELMGQSKENVSQLQIKGSGTIASISGDMQYAVAEANDGETDTQKFATLSNAVDYVNYTSGSVTVLRSTSEDVEVNDGVTIQDPGSKMSGTITPADGEAMISVNVSKDASGNDIAASGTYVLNTKFGGDDLDQLDVVLPTDNKEVASKTRREDGKIQIVTQTHEEVLTSSDAVPQALSDEGFYSLTTTDEGVLALREFLEAYASNVYVSAEVDEYAIKDVMETVGDNGFPYWNDMAMGISPTTELKPVSTVQREAGKIALAVPALVDVQSHPDYEVTYTYSGNVGDKELIEDISSFSLDVSDVETAETYTIYADITQKEYEE